MSPGPERRSYLQGIEKRRPPTTSVSWQGNLGTLLRTSYDTTDARPQHKSKAYRLNQRMMIKVLRQWAGLGTADHGVERPTSFPSHCSPPVQPLQAKLASCSYKQLVHTGFADTALHQVSGVLSTAQAYLREGRELLLDCPAPEAPSSSRSVIRFLSSVGTRIPATLGLLHENETKQTENGTEHCILRILPSTHELQSTYGQQPWTPSSLGHALLTLDRFDDGNSTTFSVHDQRWSYFVRPFFVHQSALCSSIDRHPHFQPSFFLASPHSALDFTPLSTDTRLTRCLLCDHQFLFTNHSSLGFVTWQRGYLAPLLPCLSLSRH